MITFPLSRALSSALSMPLDLDADGLSLDLQFAADKTLTARKGPTPVFTRASTATFVGSDGLIQSAAVNAARFDHDPLTLACKGLLIEEARTNLAVQSQVIAAPQWLIGLVTVANSGTGPSGATAQEVSETLEIGVHSIGNQGGSGGVNATPVVSGTTYTGSIFIKKSTVDWVQLTFGSSGFGSVQYANFNIANGTVGNSAGLASGTSPRIEAFPNGWYRCSMSATATATINTLNLGVVFTNNTDSLTRVPAYLGNTANKLLASLAQFEAGAFPTSYIPTTTAALARSADVCSITGSDFTGFYNQSEGTIIAAASVDVLAGNNRGIYGINNNTVSHGFATLYNAASSGVISQSRNTASTTLSPTFTNSAGVKFTRALAYYLGGCSIATNGSAVTDTAATISTQTMLTLQIGNTLALSFIGSCHIPAIRYFKKRLANAKLIALTT